MSIKCSIVFRQSASQLLSPELSPYIGRQIVAVEISRSASIDLYFSISRGCDPREWFIYPCTSSTIKDQVWELNQALLRKLN